MKIKTLSRSIFYLSHRVLSTLLGSILTWPMLLAVFNLTHTSRSPENASLLETALHIWYLLSHSCLVSVAAIVKSGKTHTHTPITIILSWICEGYKYVVVTIYVHLNLRGAKGEGIEVGERRE